MIWQSGGALALGIMALVAPLKEARESFLAAARRGDAAAVQAWLRKGMDPNAKSEYGGTALAFASDKGHLEVVRVLLKHKANPNAKDSFYGAVPLTWAASHGHAEVVKALLEAGATGADAALMSSVREGNLAMVQAILDKAKVKPASLDAALTMTSAESAKLVAILKKAGAKVAANKTGFKIDAATLKRYAGVYEGEGIEIKLVPQNDLLIARYGDTPLFVLSATDKKTFKAVDNPLVAVTMEFKGNQVAGFSLGSILAKSSFKRVDPSAATVPAKPAAIVDPGGKVAAPQNWPAFRGNFASGVADGQFPPIAWNAETGTNVVWKTPIPGLGHSSPIIWGNRIFVSTAVSGDPKSQFKPGQYGDVDSVNDTTVHTWKVLALDKRNGKILWERVAYQGIPKVKRHTKASHANPTPATDGNHVVVCFGSEGLFCYDGDGKLLWKQNLGVLNAGWFYDPDYQWGFASSPIVFKNLAIVQCDIGKNSFLAAYNLADGRRIWQTEREENPSWGSPTIVVGKTRSEIVTNASKFVRGYDPATGKELWRLGRNSEVTVATPVAGHDLIFVTSGYPPIRPVYAIRQGATGVITLEKGKTSSSAIAWSNAKNGTYMPTPIVYGDYFYTCSNDGLVTCYEATTGKQRYQQRIRGRGGYTASPVAADGRLYLTSEEGGVMVVKAGPTLQVLSTNPMGDVCMATPAISDGMIFIRTQHFLYALGRTQQARGGK